MTKWQLQRPDAPWDYPTLGFRADTSDAILDGTLFDPDLTVPPDAYWAVYTGASPETGITRYQAPAAPPFPAPETLDGYTLVYSDAENQFVPSSPADFMTSPVVSAATDDLVASLIPDPGTATGAALDAAIAETATFVNVKSFGATGDGTTDDTSAINAAIAAMTSGGTIFFPPGIYLVLGTLTTVPGTISLIGSGYSYVSAPGETYPTRGSIIRAGSAMERLVQVGSDALTSVGTQTSGQVRNLTIDGAGLADWPLRTIARRQRFSDLYILRGAVGGWDYRSQNGYLDGYITIDQFGVGDCMLMQNNTYDTKIAGTMQVRGWGVGASGIHVYSSGTDIHFLGGFHGYSPNAGKGLIWLDAEGGGHIKQVTIQSGIFDAIDGPQITISANGTDHIRNVKILDSTGFQPEDALTSPQPFIRIEGNYGVYGLIVRGNDLIGSTIGYSSIVHDAGIGARARIVIEENQGAGVTDWATYDSGSQLPAALAQARNNYVSSGQSNDSGTVTFTGDGIKTSFIISTKCSTALTRWQVTPATSAASAAWHATAHATAPVIIVTFDIAPSDTAQIIFQWEAYCGPRSTEPIATPTIGTPFLQDTFTDTSGTALTAHTGETGATWTKQSGFTGTLTIGTTGNLYKSSGSTSWLIPSGNPASADYGVETDINLLTVLGGDSIGIGIRAVTNNGYLLRYQSNDARWHIFKEVAGVPTELGSWYGANTKPSTHTVMLTAVDIVIAAYIDGAQVIQVIDPDYVAAGKPFLYTSGSANATDTTGYHFASIKAGPLT